MFKPAATGQQVLQMTNYVVLFPVISFLSTGKDSKAEELLHESIKCKEKYHENEAVQYYCQDCNVCICQKCGILIHNRHAMMDIQQAVEQKKNKMKQVFARVKEQMVIVDKQIIEQTELKRISEEEICAAEKEVTNVVQEIVRIAREHETAAKTKLAEIKATQKITYKKKLEEFQVFKDQLRNSVECGEDIVQKKVGLEILQAGNTVIGRCEKLLTTKDIEIFNPQHVIYRVNAEAMNTLRHLVPGQVITRYTDPSKSVAEGNGLQEAEIGAETDFTVTTRDSEGKLVYDEDDQVTVKIRSPKGEDEEIKPKHCQNGNYSVCYVPKSIGLHDIIVEVSGKPLTGSPWRVQVTAHHYKAFHSFRSREKGPVEFEGPESIAVSEKTGNIAIADFLNGRVQLFDSKWKYLRTIGDQGPCAERIGHPRSVAFTASGDVVVIHNETGQPRKMFLFTEHGQFIKHIGQCLITPLRVSVRSDGHMIILSDSGDDSVKVLTPDGAGLVQSFKAPDCDAFPSYAVYHEDRFFVSFAAANCVKVFNKRGEFQYDIGWEEPGDGQLKCPLGLAIDRFNNLIVCDSFNSRLQVFSLDGKFINSFNVGMKRPWSVAVTKDHKVLVSDTNQNVIHVFN